MAVQHDGKSPGKLWYAWQKSKALSKSFFDYTTEKDARAGAKSAGISLGTLAGSSAVFHYVAVLAAVPLLPTVVGLVAGTVAINFGMKAFRKFQLVNNSPMVYNYVRQQEYKWVDRKTRKPLGQRLKAGIVAKLDKIPLGVVKAAKWAGVALAGLGAVATTGGLLNYAGIPAISSSPAMLTVLGGIAKAGALVGLTATAAVGTAVGIAVAAIPLGVLLAVKSRDAVYRRSNEGQSFKPSKQPKTPPVTQGNEPISKGVVFGLKSGQSFDFNDNAPPAQPPAASAEISDARRQAAEARAAARKNKGNSNRFN